MNEEMAERVKDMGDKLDYVTDGFVVPTKDKSKREVCVVLRSPEKSYYVMRRQVQQINSHIEAKVRKGFVVLVRVENPNAVNLLIRLKENFKSKLRVVVNTVHLTTITEKEFLELIHEIDTEKKALSQD